METAANFRPGFRISEVDVGVVILGILVSVSLGRLDDTLGVATLFTVAHFFLFCNVLRMNRPLELIWAVLVVLLAGSTLLVGVPTWSLTLILTLSVTAVFAVIQVLLPSYHGVFWRTINPNLPRWWEINGVGKQ
jgi:hypothetical protein